MVSANIRPGLKGQRQTLVCEHHVAPYVDKFSTPAMIRLLPGQAKHRLSSHEDYRY